MQPKKAYFHVKEGSRRRRQVWSLLSFWSCVVGLFFWLWLRSPQSAQLVNGGNTHFGTVTLLLPEIAATAVPKQWNTWKQELYDNLTVGVPISRSAPALIGIGSINAASTTSARGLHQLFLFHHSYNELGTYNKKTKEMFAERMIPSINSTGFKGHAFDQLYANYRLDAHNSANTSLCVLQPYLLANGFCYDLRALKHDFDAGNSRLPNLFEDSTAKLSNWRFPTDKMMKTVPGFQIEYFLRGWKPVEPRNNVKPYWDSRVPAIYRMPEHNDSWLTQTKEYKITKTPYYYFHPHTAAIFAREFARAKGTRFLWIVRDPMTRVWSIAQNFHQLLHCKGALPFQRSQKRTPSNESLESRKERASHKQMAAIRGLRKVLRNDTHVAIATGRKLLATSNNSTTATKRLVWWRSKVDNSCAADKNCGECAERNLLQRMDYAPLHLLLSAMADVFHGQLQCRRNGHCETGVHLSDSDLIALWMRLDFSASVKFSNEFLSSLYYIPLRFWLRQLEDTGGVDFRRSHFRIVQFEWFKRDADFALNTIRCFALTGIGYDLNTLDRANACPFRYRTGILRDIASRRHVWSDEMTTDFQATVASLFFFANGLLDDAIGSDSELILGSWNSWNDGYRQLLKDADDHSLDNLFHVE